MNTTKYLQTLVDNLSMSEIMDLRDMCNEKLGDTTDTDERAKLIDTEVRKHLANGQVLVAVKYYKDMTGIGLKEAKDIVDNMRFNATT